MPESQAGDAAVRRTLRSLELRCPPLPETLVDALALMDSPEKLEAGPITEIVQRDPIVIARLLHTANSAYYGLRHTISSADRAVVMLGPVAVAGIVLGMHMLNLRSVLDGPASAHFQRLIRHCTATAFLTRHMLAPSGGMPDGRDASRMGAPFTAGLLHDFGKIILIYNFPDIATSVYDRNAPASEDELENERQSFGCDHTEAGEFAARKLNFPEELIAVIRHHHTLRLETDHPETNRLLRVTVGADLAAKAMGYAFMESCEPTTVLGDPIWPQIVKTDLVGYASSHQLVSELFGLQTHLDQYVAGVMEPA